jgi:hypothetical protein
VREIAGTGVIEGIELGPVCAPGRSFVLAELSFGAWMQGMSGGSRLLGWKWAVELELRMPDSKSQMADLKSQMPDFGSQIPDSKIQFPSSSTTPQSCYNGQFDTKTTFNYFVLR